MELNLNTTLEKFLERTSVQGGIYQFGNENSITIVTPEEGKLNVEECVNKLANGLKEIYKQLTLPKLSWLDDGKDLPLDTFYMELQLDKDKSSIQLEEIFNFDCNRILIESRPGYGKTTLCTKLLYDWANDATYTSDFLLAFLVPLRNLPEEGIEERLATIIPDLGIDKTVLMEIINKIGKQILIVLDGFDEISKDQKQNVLRVVYRKTFCEAVVILTCRTGEFYVQSEDLENIFGTAAFQREFSNVKCIITGISEQEVSKFVDNIKPHCDTESLMKVSKINPELSQCPLFIIIFTFLVSCSENIEDLNTETKLYSSLFNCIIKHSLAREKRKVSCDFNIFDINEKSSIIYQERLQEFGDFIYKNSKFQLQFDVCSLTEKIYKLGFLVKHKKMSLFKTTSHFEAFHKSILEFIVAYTLWRKCSLVDFKFTDEIIKQIIGVFMHHKNSLIMPFFIGLCKSNLGPLMKFLKSYLSVYANVAEFVWEIASRNKLNSSSLQEFCDLIPYHSCASSMSLEELKSGIELCKIKKVCLINDDFAALPSILIPELRWIITDESKVTKQSLQYLKNVKCYNFILDFQYGVISPTVFQLCLQSFRLVQSDRNIIINLSSEVFDKLPSEFSIDRVKIHHVDCLLTGKSKKEFERFSHFASAFGIDSLIKCEVLENTFTRGEKLVDLMALLPTSSDAVVIGKSGERIVFNFYNLLEDDRREWYQNVSKSRFVSNVNYKTISYLNVNSPDPELLNSVLKVTSLYVLRCLANHLVYVFDTLPFSWPGFERLEELSLILCDDLSPKLWEKVKKFRNLKSLELQMMCKLLPSNHIEPFLSCLLSLSITNLSFHIELKDDNIFTIAFAKNFKEIAFKKTFQSSYTLNTVSIISVHNCDHSLVYDLLECIKMKLLLKAQFIASPNDWRETVSKIGVNYLSSFNVSHISSSRKNPNDDLGSFKLPIAFSRPTDDTQQITYIQIQLK